MKNADKCDSLKLVRDITGLADICYTKQREQNGWGDTIACAEKYVVDEPFAVLLGDSITEGPQLCTKQLIDVRIEYGKSAISFEEVPKEKVERYGIIMGMKSNQIFMALMSLSKSRLQIRPLQILQSWADTS